MRNENHSEAESFYRIFQNLTDFAIFTLDAEGCIKTWNAGAKKIFGYDADEIIGKPLSTIFPPNEKDQANWEMNEARKNGRADDERWHVRKNQELFWASGVLSTVQELDGGNAVIAFVKVLRDLTVRKRAEEERDRLLEQVQQSSQAKDRFLATLSHELRTPLAAIVGWSGLMRNEQLPAEKIKTAIDSIYRNAHVQSGLIQDLLDMSRITAGHIKIEPGSVDLMEVVRDAVDSVRFMATTKDIAIHCNVEEKARYITADGKRLQQILWNLLTNAIKFTPAKGHVSLTAKDSGRDVEMEVRDTGRGMAPEFIPYAFDLFRQEQDSNARPYGGMGLGLSIVKQLTELHGGHVTASSEGLEKGSTFKVTLPAIHTAKASNAAAHDVLRNSLDGARVFILENDLDCLAFLRTAMREYGGVVESASTVSEALTEIPGFKPNVVLVDLVLPDEDGFSFVRKLRSFEDPKIRQLPVIALTALVSEQIRERALSEGFQLFIAKPIAPEDLVAEISNLLRFWDSEGTRRLA